MDNTVLIDNHIGTGKTDASVKSDASVKLDAVREYFAQLSAADRIRRDLAAERDDNAAYRRILAYIIAREGAVAIPRELLDGDDAPEIVPTGVNMSGDVLLGVRG